MKINPKFLISMAFFLDDLWYYKFHRQNYTKSAKFFMEKIDLIYLLKMRIWFLDFFNQKFVGI